MQTRQTELARIELLLREQLARTQAAEWSKQPRRSAFDRLVARLPRLTGVGRALSSLVLVPAFAIGRFTRQKPAPKHKPASKHEDALTALFAQDGPSVVPDEPAFATPRRETRRLPNLSGSGASNRTMKQVPEREWGPPPAVQFPMPVKKSGHRSDLVIAGLGVALGLVCALFPWYIFFNQEQFGVQAIRFGGRGGNVGRATMEAKSGGMGTPVAQEIPDNGLDLLSTGTLQSTPETPETSPSLDQQPFPTEAAKFRLVHIANGRAMMEDDAGLWIVQQGSILPDSSTVKSIEQRKGRWVLVTSTDRVMEISK